MTPEDAIKATLEKATVIAKANLEGLPLQGAVLALQALADSAPILARAGEDALRDVVTQLIDGDLTGVSRMLNERILTLTFVERRDAMAATTVETYKAAVQKLQDREELLATLAYVGAASFRVAMPFVIAAL